MLILPQRQTALVAKQAIELDLLSRGRLRLGVGTGWNHVEYESLGVPFADRGARLDEQVALLRKLWSEPVIDYRGEVPPHRPRGPAAAARAARSRSGSAASRRSRCGAPRARATASCSAPRRRA